MKTVAFYAKFYAKEKPQNYCPAAFIIKDICISSY